MITYNFSVFSIDGAGANIRTRHLDRASAELEQARRYESRHRLIKIVPVDVTDETTAIHAALRARTARRAEVQR
ncbi:MAG: hypothetical protein H0U76_29260 [Ktedonobacteraceae bacterium]|nr:hypothetical protein [Ktedonobacteraceae bacterium]